MSEKDVIKRFPGEPVTKESIIKDLEKIGLKKNMTVLTHFSLSSMGWVCGGPVAVIYALETVLTSKGNLVMPAHSGDYSDPEKWVAPPVPKSWWKTIRDTMPSYSSELTPTRKMLKQCSMLSVGINARPDLHKSITVTGAKAGI